MKVLLSGLLAAAGLAAEPIARPDGPLEPSVLNEVEHALALAPTNVPALATLAGVLTTNGVSVDVFGTNALERAEVAIRLVSLQRADGRWLAGTNDVTAAAVEILEGF